MNKRWLLIPLSFITPLGAGAQQERRGIQTERITERDWWQAHESHGIVFTAAPAQHMTGRNGINNYETLWASWVSATPDTHWYFSGDSKPHSGGRV